MPGLAAGSTRSRMDREWESQSEDGPNLWHGHQPYEFGG